MENFKNMYRPKDQILRELDLLDESYRIDHIWRETIAFQDWTEKFVALYNNNK